MNFPTYCTEEDKALYHRLHPIKNNSKYQWPADKLTDKEMAILYNWRERTKTPINYLLQQAINELSKIIGKG